VLVRCLVALVALVLAGCGGATLADPGTAAPGAGVAAPAGFPVVDEADLPPTARETLVLIDAGGPFPYDQDGSTFQNREGLLPPQQLGYYAEFTVEKPGENDRGPWRLVTGEAGEVFWTEDHYDSFAWVAR
jgi:ribonuclease T1